MMSPQLERIDYWWAEHNLLGRRGVGPMACSPRILSSLELLHAQLEGLVWPDLGGSNNEPSLCYWEFDNGDCVLLRREVGTDPAGRPSPRTSILLGKTAEVAQYGGPLLPLGLGLTDSWRVSGSAGPDLPPFSLTTLPFSIRTAYGALQKEAHGFQQEIAAVVTEVLRQPDYPVTIVAASDQAKVLLFGVVGVLRDLLAPMSYSTHEVDDTKSGLPRLLVTPSVRNTLRDSNRIRFAPAETARVGLKPDNFYLAAEKQVRAFITAPSYGAGVDEQKHSPQQQKASLEDVRNRAHKTIVGEYVTVDDPVEFVLQLVAGHDRVVAEATENHDNIVGRIAKWLQEIDPTEQVRLVKNWPDNEVSTFPDAIEKTVSGIVAVRLVSHLLRQSTFADCLRIDEQYSRIIEGLKSVSGRCSLEQEYARAAKKRLGRRNQPLDLSQRLALAAFAVALSEEDGPRSDALDPLLSGVRLDHLVGWTVGQPAPDAFWLEVWHELGGTLVKRGFSSEEATGFLWNSLFLAKTLLWVQVPTSSSEPASQAALAARDLTIKTARLLVVAYLGEELRDGSTAACKAVETFLEPKVPRIVRAALLEYAKSCQAWRTFALMTAPGTARALATGGLDGDGLVAQSLANPDDVPEFPHRAARPAAARRRRRRSTVLAKPGPDSTRRLAKLQIDWFGLRYLLTIAGAAALVVVVLVLTAVLG